MPNIDSVKKQKKRILIISHDKIGTQMAGPGIRYHYMAEELAKDFDVTIGFFDQSYIPDAGFKKTYAAKHIDAYEFQSDFEGFDVVIALWLSDSMMNYCNIHHIFVVFDVYAPVPVENLVSALYSGKEVGRENNFEYKQSLSMYRKFFENGDLFLFSNRRQLDYWAGFVFGSDQVRPSTYAKRPFFDRFIYAPMGIDATTPLKITKPVMRGIIEGIAENDKILLWTGGIWGWYDGKILITAMAKLSSKRPDIKLVFFGTKHPNPNIPEMKESYDTRQLAAQLGVLNKTVFFLDGWVNYPDRINYLLEADVAINTHKPSIETEFSHRTRVLDHILALLPTIGTQGDYLSDEVIEAQRLGIIVPPDNEEALEEAIVRVLEPGTYNGIKGNISAIRSDYDWSATLSDLRRHLVADSGKLERLPDGHPLTRGRLYATAKRITPTFVKKVIIRAINYGN